MAGIKIVDLPALGRNLSSTDLFELSLTGGTGSRKITGQEILNSARLGLQPNITLTTTGSSGSSTFAGDVLNVPTYTLSGLGGVPTTRTLTINGVAQDLSSNRSWTISTGLSIGTTPITSGVVGQILFEGAGNVVSESANLFWDNTNARLGIGTSTPSAIVQAVGSVTASGAIARGIYFNNTLVSAANSDTLIGLDIAPTFTNGAFTGVSNIGVFLRSGKFVINSSTSSFASGNLEIYNNASLYSPMVIQQAPTAFRGLTVGTGNHFIFGFGGISASSPLANKCLLMSIGASDILITQGGSSSPTAAEVTMQMFGATKNVGINTTTDAGYKLDVNGTARVSGQITGMAQFSNSTPAFTSAIVLNGINTTDTTTRYLINLGALSSTGIGYGAVGIYAAVDNYGVGSFMKSTTSSAIGYLTNADSGTSAVPGFAVRTNGQGTGGSIAYTWMSGNTTYFYHAIYNDGTYPNLKLYNRTGDIYYVRDRDTTNITFGASVYYASAQLAIDSNTKGFLPPRMTTTQKNAITSPAAGLVVYDTTLNKLCVYTTAWETITSV